MPHFTVRSTAFPVDDLGRTRNPSIAPLLLSSPHPSPFVHFPPPRTPYLPGQPSRQPTKQPVARPTTQPSVQPSVQPTTQPTRQPSGQPTRQPSQQPSAVPTGNNKKYRKRAQKLHYPTNIFLPSPLPVFLSLNLHPIPPLTTVQPSTQPSKQPINRPTSQPSRQVRTLRIYAPK